MFGKKPKPPIYIVREYHDRKPFGKDASEYFQKDANIMAAQGYFVESTAMTPGWAGGGTKSMTVTYRLKPSPDAEPAPSPAAFR